MIPMTSVSEYLNKKSSLQKQDLQVDMSNTTSNAYVKIDATKSKRYSPVLGSETLKNTPVNVSRVKVVTPFDKKTHTYFHSMSIDTDVADFMGTAELRCPYDRDLMSYWEPARAYCVIYGSNRGDYKVLFIGRVREVNQQGYEIVISLQNYGWKFKQLITQSYANDNVVSKDGYTIMKLIFEALKIDSWVISPTAKYRLKQVGVDSEGNITLNQQKVEEMPDLLERLKKTDPNKGINKYTVYNKIKESEVHNVKNINYTLKYEKPTKVMQKIANQAAGSYSPGTDIYGTNYGSGGSAGSAGSAAGSAASKLSASGTPRPPEWVCDIVKSTTINSAMRLIWSYNHKYADSYQSALETIVNYAGSVNRAGYKSQAVPCLNTLAKGNKRGSGDNAAQVIRARADAAYNQAQLWNSPSTSSKSRLPSAAAIKRHRSK